MRVYFDNAASTPLDQSVMEAMLPYMQEHFGNPSSIHGHGRTTRSAIEVARKKIAELLGAAPSEIFFTSGGTEADNMAIFGSIEALNIQHAVSSPLEHHAVLHALEHQAKTGKVQLTMLEVDSQGNLNLDQLKHILQNQKNTLVSLMHANNEIGNLYDIQAIAEICREYQAVFHSDTVQTVGHFPLNLHELKVGFIAGTAHKFHGPKGIGLIYINSDYNIPSLIHGGSQERNMRGGTENVYGIVGMTKALELAYQNMEADRLHILGIKEYMIQKLQNANIEGLVFNGACTDPDKSLYTVLSVSLPPSDINEMLVFNLDIHQISASAGSACTSGSHVGSHVLQALGLPSDYATIRFSFSKFNTKAEVDYVVDTLKKLYQNHKIAQA
ncbi:MAG: cysteine desulfurase family protein [Microscillaceae bacterium]|nr:cysteine desulfurase family protein [Microscillaceae bacterium]